MRAVSVSGTSKSQVTQCPNAGPPTTAQHSPTVRMAHFPSRGSNALITFAGAARLVVMPNSTSPGRAKARVTGVRTPDHNHSRCRMRSARRDQALTPKRRSMLVHGCRAGGSASRSPGAALSAADPPLPQNISLPPARRLASHDINHFDDRCRPVQSQCDASTRPISHHHRRVSEPGRSVCMTALSDSERSFSTPLATVTGSSDT